MAEEKDTMAWLLERGLIAGVLATAILAGATDVVGRIKTLGNASEYRHGSHGITYGKGTTLAYVKNNYVKQ